MPPAETEVDHWFSSSFNPGDIGFVTIEDKDG